MGGSGLCSRVINGPRLRETFQVPLDVNIQVRERDGGAERWGAHIWAKPGREAKLAFIPHNRNGVQAL